MNCNYYVIISFLIGLDVSCIYTPVTENMKDIRNSYYSVLCLTYICCSIKLTRDLDQLVLEAFVKVGVHLVVYYVSSVTDIVVIAHACHKIVDQVKWKWPGFFWLPVILP